MGFALYLAQMGDKHPKAKPLKGFHGARVLEVVENFDRNSYRTVYTVRLNDIVYVLHAFRKKAKRGSETPKHDLELIGERYAQARETHAQRFERG